MSGNNSPLIRLKPYYYIHVLDNNANVTRVEVGPQAFIRRDHEVVVEGPKAMITIPPRHCCVIANPVARDANGVPLKGKFGEVKLRHGDQDIRFEQDPFPLYPGETLVGTVSPLIVVPADSALRLRALRDHTEAPRRDAPKAAAGKGKEAGAGAAGVKRVAGDEWLFLGPGTYYPTVEVEVDQQVDATIIKPNQALRLRARRGFTDRTRKVRKAGEEWLLRSEGSYLPDVEEEIVATVEAKVLTEKTALALRAIKSFKDVFGKDRKAGEEWLVTLSMADAHIPDVSEEIVGTVALTTLSTRQYCVVLDPYVGGKQKFGSRELRKGEQSFFLQPGERLEKGIQSVHVLGEDQALLLRAREAFKDTVGGKEVSRKPGDRWMIHGPCDYVPPIRVEIVEMRRAIPLDENEGIYVRDIQTGQVRSEIGHSYMLKPNEELWAKELPTEVENLLTRDVATLRERSSKTASAPAKRDRTRVVTFRAPHNSAVQIYDYKKKTPRVVFGPELILLGPDESFTVLSLSGGKPKRPHAIKSLALLLGPDFMTDIVTVETSDHARLSLQLSYNWAFKPASKNADDAAKLFQVPDFVGDACKAIASRVRGAVAAVPFDNFHKNSARIIRSAVFGTGKDGKVRADFFFPSNSLTITNIDIQSVEPVDPKTRDALQKSVQLAIEITTNSQEATARHEAQRLEQQARGMLERQKIKDQADAEAARGALLKLQAESAAVESTGQAKAEATARAEAANIEGQAAVTQAELKSKALDIESSAELKQYKAKNLAEIEHQEALAKLEISRARDLAEIEAGKFKQTVDAIGADTIKAIASAGPENQAKLLQGLGLQGFLITDGKNPINLFQTANGLVSQMGPNGGVAPQ